MREDYIKIPGDLSEEEQQRFDLLVADDATLCMLSAFMNDKPVVVICRYENLGEGSHPVRLYPLAKLLTDVEMGMLTEPFDGKRPGLMGSEVLQ